MTVMKRQGDILLERITDDRRINRKMEDGIIARGETTGHAHRVENGDLGWAQGGAVLVEAREGTAVVHEEHDRVELEPGIWLVHRQTEYVAPGETVGVYD